MKNAFLMKSVIDFFYPDVCLGCGEIIEENGEYFCKKCEKEVESYPLDWNWIIEDISFVDNIYSPFVYSGKIREILRSIKFGQNIVSGILLGRLIASRLRAEQFNFENYDYIFPVPMSNSRYKKRKFNQLNIFLKEIAKSISLPAMLKGERVIDNSQVGLGAKERKENIKGAFVIGNNENLKGKRIIIFDDVVTTGATSDEIAFLFKKAGAELVDLLVCCRAEKLV